MSTRSYHGTCHCGAVRFRFTSEEITRGVRCNCSICVRKGIVMSGWVARARFEQLEGLEALRAYRFGDRLVNHWFCPTCGVHPFSESVRPGDYRVNLGCVEGLDVLALPVDVVDGQSL